MGQQIRRSWARCMAVLVTPVVVAGLSPAASASPPVPGAAARAAAPAGLAAAPASLRAAISTTLGTSAPTGYAQQAELTASNSTADQRFGNSVALDALGTTALVGASDYLAGTGAAFVFTLSRGTWSPTATLFASDGALGDGFGSSVALNALGTTALVGSPGHNVGAGAVHVFTLSHGTWSQTAELTASDGAPSDHFGSSVALNALGTTALVGASNRNLATGAAYVFTLRRGTWSQTAELTASNGGFVDQFGSSVALNALGTTALAGAPSGNSETGAAYVFTLRRGTWSQTAELTASNAGLDEGFGSSVALNFLGTTALAGEPFGNAAYVFTLHRGTWSQTAELTASGTTPTNTFGSSVALNALGTTALVGAWDNSATGAAYVFTRCRRTWSQTAELTASDGGGDFGSSVALNFLGTTALAGAPGHNSFTGAAYVFTAGRRQSVGNG
jgi:FG-GAP repeat